MMKIKQKSEIYDEIYYRYHYGKILENSTYHELLSRHWKHVIFTCNDIDPDSLVLDYGCGLGQVSASLANATLFDSSQFATKFLRTRGLNVLNRIEDIPIHYFDFLISSHSLEHCPNPADKLKEFCFYLKPSGKLILILPIEENYNPSLEPDENQHFQCWTFQAITNLLLYCGWQPILQNMVFHPFGLDKLGKIMSQDKAVSIAYRLGTFKRNYPSLMTIAKLLPSD
jgi:SAM-dependent methyltransferase